MGIDTSANGVFKSIIPERLYRSSAWQPDQNEKIIQANRMGFVAGMRISGTVFLIFLIFFVTLLAFGGLNLIESFLFTGLIWFIFALILAKRATTWKTSRFFITTQRVWAISGLLSLKETVVPLSDIVNVGYSQSPLGRVFNYGTLKLETVNGRKVKICGISDISGFSETLLTALR